MCDCTLRLVWMWLCYFRSCTDERSHSDSPGCLHQLLIVVIVINRCWHSRVVIVPFLSGNSSVTISVSKVREELHEDLIFSHRSVDHLGMETAIVDALEISSVDEAVSVTVKLKVCLVGDSLSLGVQVSLNRIAFSTNFLLWFQQGTHRSWLNHLCRYQMH